MTLAFCFKNIIFTMENENQVAYVNNRFISEGRRLVTDVLEVINSLDIEGFNYSRYRKSI